MLTGISENSEVCVDPACIGATMRIPIAEWYASNTLPALRVQNVAHLIMDAGDMHTMPWNPARAGSYSLTGNRALTHFDPFHKLTCGLVNPYIIPICQDPNQGFELSAVEDTGEIAVMYDPFRGDREYFDLEKRWGGTASNPNYDFTVSPLGPIVWHVVEDPETARDNPPDGVNLTKWNALTISD